MLEVSFPQMSLFTPEAPPGTKSQNSGVLGAQLSRVRNPGLEGDMKRLPSVTHRARDWGALRIREGFSKTGTVPGKPGR